MNRNVLYIGAIAAVSVGGLAFYSALPRASDARHSGGATTESASSDGANGNGVGSSGADRTGNQPGASKRGNSGAAQGTTRTGSGTEDKSGISGWFDRLVGGGEGETSGPTDGASGRAVSGQDKPGFFERLFGRSSSDDSRSPAGGGVGAKNAGNPQQPGATGRPGSQDSTKTAKGESNTIGAPGAIGSVGAGARAPGTTLCSGAPSKNTERCLKCEAEHCVHDPKYQLYCEDFADPKDQARCQAVLDCVRVSNCIATGSVSCYCGPDLNVVTCKSNPPSPGAPTGAHGDCVAEILAGFPPDSTSKFVIDHFADMKTPSGAALGLGQCDYANCGDIAGTNDCIPYCPE